MRKIQEASAEISVPEEKKISKKLSVFYNPVMKINRDISILLLNAIENKGMQIADPLAGTGIRSVRFMKELLPGKIKNISVNDASEKAAEGIRINIRENGLESPLVSVHNEDANVFLMKSTGFDYIDIDPFGSPVPFLDASVSRLSRNGILAVTATDTAALAGTSPEACQRRYHAKPLRNHFMHETGIRILIKKVQEAGAEHEKALTPIFSYAYEHYYRVFFRCEKGRIKADNVLREHGYILYCRRCSTWETCPDIFNRKKCPQCGSAYEYAGPLWLGQLWEAQLAEKMYTGYSGDDRLKELLRAISSESRIPAVGFYDMHSTKTRNLPKLSAFLDENSSRTHFLGWGIRSSKKPMP